MQVLLCVTQKFGVMYPSLKGRTDFAIEVIFDNQPCECGVYV
jgi:hypothetical protein